MENIKNLVINFNYMAIVKEVVTALVIVLVTLVLTKVIKKAFRKLPEKSKKVSLMLSGLIARVVNLIIWAFAVISILQTFGFNLTPILTGLGVSGVVLGFALQESIASFFAGFLIALNAPFKKGDYVTIGNDEGTVESMDLMCVVLHTSDNKTITLANRNVWGATIVNYSDTGKRRLDLAVGVSYDSDTDKVKEIINDILRSYSEVIREDGITVEIKTLNASSVDFTIRVWVKTDDYWKVYFRFNSDVLKALKKEGIEIPYNKLDINVTEAKILKE